MINLMLDSGAFSAWTQGKSIDLDVYCDYIERNQEWIGSYVALDVINPKDPNAAAAASFENLIKMRKRGLRPIPVFHVGERFDWLHRMLDLGCDYIGLSATSLTARSNIDPWYASAWAQLTDSDGLPVVKVHAFGETRYPPLSLFPWASADSTAWIHESQINGQIKLPGGTRIGVRNDKLSKRSVEDIDLLTEANKHEFNAHMERYGIDPERLKARDSLATFLRTYLTVLWFQELETRTRALHPITFSHARGFHTSAYSKREPVDVEPFNLYFVTNATWWSVVIPAKAGVCNTLASFFYILEHSNHFQYLPAYVRDPIGFISSHEKPAKLWNLLGEHINAPRRVQEAVQSG